MHPMSTEDFLREIVFGNNGNSSSSGTFLTGGSGPMPPQAAGWQGEPSRRSLLGAPQASGSAFSGPGAGVFRMRCTTNQHGKVEAREEHTPMVAPAGSMAMTWPGTLPRCAAMAR